MQFFGRHMPRNLCILNRVESMNNLSIVVLCQITDGWTCVAIYRINICTAWKPNLHNITLKWNTIHHKGFRRLCRIRKKDQRLGSIVTPLSKYYIFDNVIYMILTRSTSPKHEKMLNNWLGKILLALHEGKVMKGIVDRRVKRIWEDEKQREQRFEEVVVAQQCSYRIPTFFTTPIHPYCMNKSCLFYSIVCFLFFLPITTH